MIPPSLEPGVWYIVAICPNCKYRIPLLPDLNAGRCDLKGSYVVTCPKCQKEEVCDGEHYQHNDVSSAPELVI